jgi:hypothetical protein
MQSAVASRFRGDITVMHRGLHNSAVKICNLNTRNKPLPVADISQIQTGHAAYINHIISLTFREPTPELRLC